MNEILAAPQVLCGGVPVVSTMVYLVSPSTPQMYCYSQVAGSVLLNRDPAVFDATLNMFKVVQSPINPRSNI